MSRLGLLARRHGIDVVIVLAAVGSAAEVAATHDAELSPTTSLWFAVPAAALIVLPLLGRRRFPFAAPAAVWLAAAAMSFVDGNLVPSTVSASLAGICAALLSPAVTNRVIRQFARLSHAPPPKAFGELTSREREVFRLLSNGLSNAEIGRELFIGETTVKTHVTRVLQKLDLRDRVQAVVLAHQSGLFESG